MTIPVTQSAVEIFGPDQVRIADGVPVPPVTPTGILLEIEACGICFSDTKLLHAYDSHPRRQPISAGMAPEELEAIPSYRGPGAPITPGHECVARIVAVGRQVANHRVGERVLVQTDYRHLPTRGSNAAFGYDFNGGLERYALVDERVATDPATGERFLIPGADGLSASAVALCEPWACVQAAYDWPQRQGVKKGGRALVVVDATAEATGVDALVAPAGQADRVDGAGGLPEGPYDDIVYAGWDADRIEALAGRLGFGGVLSVLLNGHEPTRAIKLDVGRVHYDLIRFVGDAGSDAAASYASLTPSTALRPGDHMAIVGAAGPMGVMHTVLSLASDVEGLTVTGFDLDPFRLAQLERIAQPVAERTGTVWELANSAEREIAPDTSYVALMVPSAALVSQLASKVAPGAIVNCFAGFAVGTTAEIDYTRVARDRVLLVGTSGSRIEDMKAVLALLETGTIDTNVSLDVVTGLAGVPEALHAVQNRTVVGKIMVYPELRDVGLTPLSVAAPHGWDRAAEQSFLTQGRATGMA